MSEFLLFIVSGDRRPSTVSTSYFCLCKSGFSIPEGALVVGKRDPDQSMEWKQGTFYYNPYFERKSAFIYRGDQKLISIEGHPISKLALQGQYQRSWFEIIPQSINGSSLPISVRHMIEAIPQQVKPVSQSLMQNLGIRVPPDFKPVAPKDWFDWLSTVQIPIGDQFKRALRHAALTKINITRETEVEFLTGKKIPVSKQVHIRMFKVQEVVKRVRQIYDTNYSLVNIPVEILEQGAEATKNWILNSEMGNRFVLENTPVSEKVLKEEVIRTTEPGIVGFTRDTSGSRWNSLWPISDLYTTNDMVREIMEEDVIS